MSPWLSELFLGSQSDERLVELARDADVAHLRGWLYAIVRHTAARAARGRQSEADLDTVVLAGEPLEDDVDRRMLALDALSEIGRLPERQRAALIGTALHGYSRAEVADSLGLSEGAVRQLVHRARASLRTAITALTPYPFARWLASVRSQSSSTACRRPRWQPARRPLEEPR